MKSAILDLNGDCGEMTRPDESGGCGSPTQRSSDRRWVGIVANAGSGRGAGRLRVERLVDELRRRGLPSRVAWTGAERADLVAESARDRACHCLVAAGGDGTVAALVNECPG